MEIQEQGILLALIFSVAFDVNPPSNTLWFFIKEWDNQIDYRRLVCRIAEKPTTLDMLLKMENLVDKDKKYQEQYILHVRVFMRL